jgi:riboflavin synthase
MFTGIVEHIGRITRLTGGSQGKRGRIVSPLGSSCLEIGESVSVNGVCLTVLSTGKDWFDVEVAGETLERSNYRDIRVGDAVNLERSLKVGDPLGGHLVYGHVDGTANFKGKKQHGGSLVFEMGADDNIIKYVVFKGSVAVNGVSLTVSEVGNGVFSVTLLPFTLEKTNLKYARPGARLNIEVDIIGKYVENFLEKKGKGDTLDLLKRSGFIEEG